jgi:ABC-type multidrug transport system ATPase subunit
VLQALVAHVAGEEMTVFFSSHQIAEVDEIADRIAIIDRGRTVVTGVLDDLRENSLDEGELEVPVEVKQEASSVTLAGRAIVSSFAGALSSDGTELAGTLTQGAVTVPLTFRRAGK